LAGLFALVLVYVVYSVRQLRVEEHAAAPTGVLDTNYTDPATGAIVIYGVRSLSAGMGASFLAGNISRHLAASLNLSEVLKTLGRAPCPRARLQSRTCLEPAAARQGTWHYRRARLLRRV
jgi:hypothetical protein